MTKFFELNEPITPRIIRDVEYYFFLEYLPGLTVKKESSHVFSITGNQDSVAHCAKVLLEDDWQVQVYDEAPADLIDIS